MVDDFSNNNNLGEENGDHFNPSMLSVEWLVVGIGSGSNFH